MMPTIRIIGVISTCAALLLTSLPAAGTATDPETGLVIADGFELVKQNCTVCHSAKLITQNRMSRERWLETIRWMQETQGLRKFDAETEMKILDYLSTHYAPERPYRKPPLEVKWE